MVVRRVFVLVALLLVWGGGAMAQSGGGTGHINAMSFAPMPKDTPVSIRALDDSDANLALKRDLADTLEAEGYEIAEDAPLVITFEVREQGGAFSDPGRRTFLELEASGGGLGGQEQSAKLNIFDTARGGMLNEGRGGTRVVTPDMRRIDITVDERGKQRLWHGWATAETRHADPVTVTRAMLAPLVRNMGNRIRQEPFSIP